MKQNYICPFCGSSVAITNQTQRMQQCCFNGNGIRTINGIYAGAEWNNVFIIYMRHCPTCDNVSFEAVGIYNLKKLSIPLYPTSLAKKFPDYIPKAIRKDYEEAYSILSLSPKASATLSRRCLQGMIRDFWGISKGRLIDEIDALEEKVDTDVWESIDAVRSVGNIGAHMEKDINIIIDVEPEEAQLLIGLIEQLVDDWYVSREDRKNRAQKLKDLAESKKKPPINKE